MKDYTIKTKTHPKKDYSISKKPEPEYVLRVNANENNDISIKVMKKPKLKDNPRNLPVKKKKKKHSGLKKFVLLMLLYVVCFIVSVTLAYNFVFKLFEL
jgi:cytoskeletal protein RodZ